MEETNAGEMKTFMDEVADDLGYSQVRGNPSNRRVSRNFGFAGKRLILGGAAVLLLVLFMIFLFGGDSDVKKADLEAVESRMDRIEKELKGLDEAVQRVARLETEVKNLGQAVKDAKRDGKSLSKALDDLSKTVAAIQKRLGATGVKSGADEGVLAPPKGGYYQVRKGDSLYKIAREYGLTVNELCALNSITPKHVLQPGDKLLVIPVGR